MSKVLSVIPMPVVTLACQKCSSVVEYTPEDGISISNPNGFQVWLLECPVCGFTFRYPEIDWHILHNKPGWEKAYYQGWQF